jgi:hypothetical protein
MLIYGLKILLCALSLGVGTMLGAMVSAAFGLQSPTMPAAVDLRLLGLSTFVGGVALSVGLAEIARRLPGSFWSRWLSVAWLAYTCLGINNTIEACIFTSIGGGPSMAVMWLPPCLLVAGLITLLFRNPTQGARPGVGVRAFFAARTPRQWTVRLLTAWVAFPVVYFTFGTPVGLLVQNSYRTQAFGLRLPSLEVIVGVEFLRSVFFLLASLPILIAWSESRRRFWVTFGLGLFVVLGLYGLIQAYWLPWGMRGLHTLEILLDSLLYAWLLATLLFPRDRPLPQPEPAPIV